MGIYNLSDEEQKRLKKAGVDWDLSGCLEYNPQNFQLSDIEKVMAVWTGENDGDDWRWVIKVTPECAKKNGGRFVFLQGGCDYTGWDCQSWATSKFAKTALKAAKFASGENVELKDSSPANAGLGHLLNLMSGDYMKNSNNVYDSLVEQLKSSKKKTWHEAKDDEFGTSRLPKIK